MNSQVLRGLGVAMVTPFNEDGSVDFDALKILTNHLIDGGADYLVVLGTTGETPTLDKEEQTKITRFVVKENNGRLPIVLGVGGNNTKAVVNQLKGDDFDGIDFILSVVPYYSRPVQEGIYKHFMAIADVSPVPVVLYNIPGRTSVNMTAETTLRVAKHANVVGIKEASCAIEQIKAIIKGKPDGFMIISGDDALTIRMIEMGGDGVISVIGNAFPSEFSKAIHKALDGRLDEAKTLYGDLDKFAEYLFIDGNPAGIKALLSELGMLKNYLRLPVVPVTAATQSKLKELLAEKNAQTL